MPWLMQHLTKLVWRPSIRSRGSQALAASEVLIADLLKKDILSTMKDSSLRYLECTLCNDVGLFDFRC